MVHILSYCRPGFEPECSAELQALAHGGDVDAPRRSGYVLLKAEPETVAHLAQGLDHRQLTFARQWLLTPGLVVDLPPADRITPLLAALEVVHPQQPVSGVWVETPDTEAGKALAPFCRKFANAVVQALKRQGRLQADDPALPRLHLCFIAPTMAFPALGFVGRSSPWPMGIPRLKQHPQAPSRSALKLEEALLTFLTFDERRRRLLPGQRAVDLGAAPGGWTWQLVRRHLFVTAVDNGALDPRLMDSGLVEHLRCDGFRYRPPRPVDWMVCDMVEKPLQVATLAAHWLAKGDCRETIFNLKLPMKRRYATLVACRAKIAQVLGHTPHTLRIKQLYHDREEVTAHLANPSAIA